MEIVDSKKIPFNERPSRAQKIVKENDVLISTVRPYLKAFALVEKNDGSLVCSTGFALIRTKNEVDSKWVFYNSQAHYFNTELIRHMQGSNYPAVTNKIVGNVLIPYTDSEKEREKIVSILSNIDSLIKKQKKIIEQTDLLKKGQMQKFFTKGIGHAEFKEINVKPRFIEYSIPKTWKISDLKSVSKKITDIDHEMPEKTATGKIFLAANNLNDDEIDFDNVEYISERDYLHHSKKFNVEKNDILISRIGSIGVARMVRTNKPFIASYSVALIKPKDEIDNEFLHYYLNSNLSQKVMIAYTIVSGNVNLVLGDLEKVPVLLPKDSEQKKISQILRNLDLFIQQQKQYKIRLEQIKKGVIQKLLSGQIMVKV